MNELLIALGIDVPRLLLGWARVMPVLVIVPAFGLSALPPAARGVMALSLAWTCAPVMAVSRVEPVSLALELALGVSIAVVASVPLWTASMVGGIADQWRGASDSGGSAFELGGASLQALATLFCAWAFFASGTPAELVSLLTRTATVVSPMELARLLSDAPRIAIGLGLPVIATACVVDIAGGLLSRAAPLAPLSSLISAAKSASVVFCFALLLPRIFEAVARV